MVAFLIQPVTNPLSGLPECCVDPCSRSSPCDPCEPVPTTTSTTSTSTTTSSTTSTSTTTSSTTSTSTTTSSTTSTSTTTPPTNWQGCEYPLTMPATIEVTITFQPSGIEETETYTKNVDFCRYDNLNSGGSGKHVTWNDGIGKWRIISGSTYLASSDWLLGSYSTLSGSNDYSVAL